MSDEACADELGDFLVHALELEHDSAEHYAQLADSMEIHHNDRAATLFRILAVTSEEHARDIARHARGVTLPRIAPWEFRWGCAEYPESEDCLDTDVTYRMTAVQAIRLALHNERRAERFYADVAADAKHASVRSLAAAMHAEEAEHVAMLEQMLEQQRDEPAQEADDDLDPPHMPA